MSKFAKGDKVRTRKGSESATGHPGDSSLVRTISSPDDDRSWGDGYVLLDAAEDEYGVIIPNKGNLFKPEGLFLDYGHDLPAGTRVYWATGTYSAFDRWTKGGSGVVAAEHPLSAERGFDVSVTVESGSTDRWGTGIIGAVKYFRRGDLFVEGEVAKPLTAQNSLRRVTTQGYRGAAFPNGTVVRVLWASGVDFLGTTRSDLEPVGNGSPYSVETNSHDTTWFALRSTEPVSDFDAFETGDLVRVTGNGTGRARGGDGRTWHMFDAGNVGTVNGGLRSRYEGDYYVSFNEARPENTRGGTNHIHGSHLEHAATYHAHTAPFEEAVPDAVNEEAPAGPEPQFAYGDRVQAVGDITSAYGKEVAAGTVGEVTHPRMVTNHSDHLPPGTVTAEVQFPKAHGLFALTDLEKVPESEEVYIPDAEGSVIRVELLDGTYTVLLEDRIHVLDSHGWKAVWADGEPWAPSGRWSSSGLKGEMYRVTVLHDAGATA